MRLPKLLGEPSCSFADDLHPSDHRGLGKLVLGKGGAASGGLRLDAFDGVQDVEQTLPVAPQTATASVSTR